MKSMARVLKCDGLLPAITFIFSRVGCEAAGGQLLAAGTGLIPERVNKVTDRIGIGVPSTAAEVRSRRKDLAADQKLLAKYVSAKSAGSSTR